MTEAEIRRIVREEMAARDAERRSPEARAARTEKILRATRYVGGPAAKAGGRA